MAFTATGRLWPRMRVTDAFSSGRGLAPADPRRAARCHRPGRSVGGTTVYGAGGRCAGCDAADQRRAEPGPDRDRGRRPSRAAVVPDWLAEVVRPKPAPLPWPDMIRAALAICVPLSVAFAVGRATIGMLPAMGGLLGTMADRGGSYLNRVKRVSAAGVFGGAVGLAIGSAIHGRGWIAVVALVVVAGASGVLSTLGDIGSATGLQLLVYASLGIGPFGALRPVWHTAAGFLVGVAWALVLILPGWLLSPHGQEQRAVAAVYQALADQLSCDRHRRVHRQAAGRDHRGQHRVRRAAHAPGRPRAGRNRRVMRLVAALNASNLMSQAATTLGVAGNRPPPLVIETVARLADAIRTGSPPPMIPPAWDTSPGALALRDAHGRRGAGAGQGLGAGRPDPGRLTRGGRPASAGIPRRRGAGPDRPRRSAGAQVSRTFVIRLMACIGVAGRGQRGAAAAAVLLGAADGGDRAQAGLRLGVRAGPAAGHRHDRGRGGRRGAARAVPRGVAADPVRGAGRAAALRAQQELRAAGHVPHPAGGGADRPAQARSAGGWPGTG